MTVFMCCLCVYVGISRRNSFKGGGGENVKLEKISFFSKKGKTVILSK